MDAAVIDVGLDRLAIEQPMISYQDSVTPRSLTAQNISVKSVAYHRQFWFSDTFGGQLES